MGQILVGTGSTDDAAAFTVETTARRAQPPAVAKLDERMRYWRAGRSIDYLAVSWRSSSGGLPCAASDPIGMRMAIANRAIAQRLVPGEAGFSCSPVRPDFEAEEFPQEPIDPDRGYQRYNTCPRLGADA